MFIQNGTTFRFVNDANFVTVDSLPVGTYMVKMTQTGEFYLESMSDFKIEHKIYGSSVKRAKRIFTTFEDRKNSTGVLLSGNKGSGKSLLAKHLSIIGYNKNIPTIIVDQPYLGTNFNQFIQNISQDSIIIFDEFEKVYLDKNDQQQLLSLLDGIFSSKKMFIFTVNNKYALDSNLLNRPGRIFYNIDYSKLEEELVLEYSKDNLHNKDYADKILLASRLIGDFNFDMLTALIEETNRFDENPMQLLEILNIRPEYGSSENFDVAILYNGVPYSQDKINHKRVALNPFKDSKWLTIEDPNFSSKTNYEDEDYEDDKYTSVSVSPLTFIKVEDQKYYYQDKEFTIILSKEKPQPTLRDYYL